MNIKITLTNKLLYYVLFVGIFLLLIVGVMAYNSDMDAGDPTVFGHSAGEIMVNDFLGNPNNLGYAMDNRLEYEKVYYNTPKDLPGEAFRICGAYMDYDPNNIDPDTGSLGVNHIPSGYEHCFFESTYSISTTAYCTLLCFR